MMERMRGTVPAVLAYLGVTVALLTWGSFVTDPVHYRVPLIVIGGLILLAGIGTRMARFPVGVSVLVQLAVALMGLSTFLCHAPLPLTSGSRDLLSQAFADCRDVLVEKRPPVPVRDGIAPLLLPGGALAYVLADLLAAGLRRASLTGLVFLGVLSVPLSVANTGTSWPVFAIVTMIFLALLGAQESDRVLHWGRRISEGPAGTPPTGAAVIGATATALAVIVPIGLPMLHIDFAGWGGSGHSNGPITVTNPMVSMYGNLKEQSNTELVDVAVSGRSVAPPEYLRIAVLTQFNGQEWSTGNRHIPADQTADQQIDPPYDNLGPTTSYQLSATTAFQSAWLPTFDFTTDINAPGDWRFDTDTYDFIAADKDLTTSGLQWTDTAATVSPNQRALRDADFDPNGVDPRYTSLPADFPEIVSQTAIEVTKDQPTPFLQAVALQQWFLQDGGFRYSLQRPEGDSNQDLLHFVTDEKVGYCQQFATAMAAMARSIGIPARVDVGFLHGERTPNGHYLFRGADMHAWPELWFQGVGWVRFDPTPGVGATPPTYTDVKLAAGHDPTVGPSAPGDLPSKSAAGDPRTRPTRSSQAPDVTPAQTDHGTVTGGSWTWLWVALGLMVAVLLAATPGWVRRRRRARRLSGDAEDVWEELHDTARDLGVPWPAGLSPRVQSTQLKHHIGTPEGRDSLDRVVSTVERARYARPDTPLEESGEEARAVIAGMLDRVEARVRRRAAIMPRSLLTRRAPRVVNADAEPELVDRTS